MRLRDEITFREVLVSISIVSIMFIIGIFIFDKLVILMEDSNAQYLKATKIKDEELFDYSLQTNVGNSLVQGEMKAVKPIKDPLIKGEYITLCIDKEEYTQHTRTVMVGKAVTTQIYYTWDTVTTDYETCKEVTFLGQKFNTSQFILPMENYIDTVYITDDVRLVYRGIKTIPVATIYCNIAKKNIGKDVVVYESNISKTLENITSTSNAFLLAFWLIWFILTLVLVYFFVLGKNDWLNKD